MHALLRIFLMVEAQFKEEDRLAHLILTHEKKRLGSTKQATGNARTIEPIQMVITYPLSHSSTGSTSLKECLVEPVRALQEKLQARSVRPGLRVHAPPTREQARR